MSAETLNPKASVGIRGFTCALLRVVASLSETHRAPKYLYWGYIDPNQNSSSFLL